MNQTIVAEHQTCDHCGEQQTWESLYDEKGHRREAPAIILAVHPYCVATLRELAHVRADMLRHFDAFDRTQTDHDWRLEQLEGSPVRRFVNRCLDVVDAFRDALAQVRK